MTAISDTPAVQAADRPSLRERTLARLVEHVRALIPADAVSFVTVRRGKVEHTAGWFADTELRASFEELAEAVAERDRPLFLPRVDAWEAAAKLLRTGPRPLGAASVVACPLRTEIGQVLGALVVASIDPERPLSKDDLGAVEVVADLAAMALERATLLEEEGLRVREEVLLKRAAESVSESLELDEVYRRIAEHAAELTGASQALLTRLNARSGELHTAARVDLSEAPAAGVEPFSRPEAPALDKEGFGHLARTRRPHIDASGSGSLMHAPIEIGPRLYGVLTAAHDEPGRFGADELQLLARLARSSAAAIANAIDFGRERRLARALTLGFVPESLPALAGLRDRPSLRARARRAHRRRRVRRLDAPRRRHRRARRGRGRQGRRERGAVGHGALLRRGAQLGHALARRRARAGQRDAHGPAAAGHLRDRLLRRVARRPRPPAAGPAPATCRPSTCRARACAPWSRTASRSESRARPATARASSSWRPATSSSPSPTAWSRRAAGRRPTAPAASRRSSAPLRSRSPRRTSSAPCTTRSRTGPAASATTPWRWLCGAAD